jgi:stress response protein YsnF
LFKEDIDVQRVPVNRVLDRPAETRVEDGVTIIPVMEERLKVEKQLILREEIRIVKKRSMVRDRRLISLAKDGSDVNSPGEPER